MGKTINSSPCLKCGSQDNLKTWLDDNGKEHTKCKTPGCESKAVAVRQADFEFKDFEDTYRGISKQTLKFLGIKEVKVNGQQIISYDHANLDGSFDIKYRYPVDPETQKKRFGWAKPKNSTTDMFALDKCTDFNKPLYITEGNEDCATLWDIGLQSSSVLSSSTAIEDITNALDYISQFIEISVCMEKDKASRPVIEEIKNILAHKCLKIVDLAPRKDANEWVNGDNPDREELLKRCLNGQENVPLGIVFGNEIDLDALRVPLPKGIEFPYPQLQHVTKGILPGNLLVLTAGVSIGKSSVMRDFSYSFRQQGYKVANIYVEEDARISQQNYIAAELGIPIGEIMLDPTIVKEEDWYRVGRQILQNPDLMFINEKWERSTTNLLNTIKYLANVKKYDIILVDHITAIINSSGIGKGGRVQDIDWLCEQLFNLGRETGIRILLVSHLKRPQSPPYWDEGKKPTMYDLRGSGSLEAKPDLIIGMSRNQKSETEVDVLKLEVLKNRWFSKLGMVDELIYINESGRLILK